MVRPMQAHCSRHSNCPCSLDIFFVVQCLPSRRRGLSYSMHQNMVCITTVKNSCTLTANCLHLVHATNVQQVIQGSVKSVRTVQVTKFTSRGSCHQSSMVVSENVRNILRALLTKGCINSSQSQCACMQQASLHRASLLGTVTTHRSS